MGDKAWKRAERRTAKDIGGERTWWELADAKGPSMSVEVKYRKQIPKWLWDAVDQARRNAENDEFPAVRLIERYRHRSICVMDWNIFVEWFGEFPVHDEFPTQGKDDDTLTDMAK